MGYSTSDPRLQQGHFVYAYLRKDDYSPYYIGYASRPYRPLERKGHCVKVPDDACRIVVLKHGLDQRTAWAWERFYIFWYGRLDLGGGNLRNQNDGGAGGPPGPITLAKLRAAAKKVGSTPAKRAAAKKRGSKRGPLTQREKENLRVLCKQNTNTPEVNAKHRLTKIRKTYDELKPPFTFEAWQAMPKDRRGTLICQIRAARFLEITLNDYLQLSRGERISRTRAKKHAEGLLIPTGKAGGARAA